MSFSSESAALCLATNNGQSHTSDLATVHMHWVGGESAPTIEGLDLQSHVSHFMRGQSANDWRTNVPHFGKLSYDNVYSGIDLEFYGRSGELEYDWIVEPGANPDDIKMRFSGADSLRLNDAGQLVLSTAAGEVVHRAPILYQWISGTRENVAGRFELFDDGTVGFDVGSYDASQSLVIDPTVVYTQTLVGADFDAARAIAVDDEGNVYIAGTTDSGNLGTPGAFQQDLGGTPGPLGSFEDAFVAMYTADGSLLWNTYLGGSAHDTALGIAVDENGGVWVAGSTGSDDFPTANAIQGSYGGEGDAFVTHLSADGSSLLSSTYLGGPEGDGATDLALGTDGAVYITGGTDGNFPTRLGLRAFAGEQDAFVSKLAADGQELLFSTYLGGLDLDIGNGIDVDETGNMYVIGTTYFPETSGFPVVNGLASAAGLNTSDAFVTKIAGDFSDVLYSTLLGGTSPDQTRFLSGEFGDDIAVDRGGIVAVAGEVTSQNFPVTPTALKTDSVNLGDFSIPGAPNLIDGFLTVLDTNREGFDALVYSTFLGGNNGNESESGYGVAFDAAGDIFVTGSTGSDDFPITPDATQPDFSGPALPNGDGFLVKIDPYATGAESLLFGTYHSVVLGSDQPNGIAVDEEGDVYIAGQAGLSGSRFWDAFITRFNIDTRRGASATLGHELRNLTEFSGLVGAFLTRREGAEPGDFEVAIDWGDGSTSAATSVSTFDPFFQVTGQHTYQVPGAYPVLMDVQDTTPNAKSPSRIINASGAARHQFAPVVTVNPTDVSRLFLAAQDEQLIGASGGIMAATSGNAGLTWTKRSIAAEGDARLPEALGFGFDAAYDAFGNLYVAYAAALDDQIIVARSIDNGETFSPNLGVISAPGVRSGGFTRIALATGPGASPSEQAVWVAYDDQQAGAIRAAVALSTALGSFGDFGATGQLGTASGNTTLQLPDIEVGPDGQVLLAWQENNQDLTFSSIVGRVDPDGAVGNEPFGAKVTVASSIEQLPDVGMHPMIAIDRSGGDFNGRMYVAYQDLGFDPDDPATRYGLDALVTYSDDNGAAWSDPTRVNNDLTDLRQLRPAISVDQDRGNVAVSWYDARHDASDSNLEYFIAASTDGAATFGPNVVVSGGQGSSINSAAAFQSGMSFRGGIATVAWADNGLVADLRDAPSLDVAVAVIGVMGVPEVPVSVRPFGFDAEEYEAFSGIVATFTHRDEARQASEFAAAIDWGDGAATEGSISQPDGPGTPFVVTGNHAYFEEGAYLVRVSIADSLTGRTWNSVSNVTHRPTSQSEGTIAINPRDPDQVFAAAVAAPFASGVMISGSVDGGATWESSFIGDGNDALPRLLGDPKAVFDRYGNLFFVVLGAQDQNFRSYLFMLPPNEATFTVVGAFLEVETDQPSVAVGPGTGGEGDTVWVTFQVDDEEGEHSIMRAYGAPVLGPGNVGDFRGFQYIPFENDALNRGQGDIEVGPNGEVLVTYLQTDDPELGADLIVQLDPDGLGPLPFGVPVKVTETTIGGFVGVYTIPAQPGRGIGPEVNIAWDRSGGPYHGRIYLTYTESLLEPDTDIHLRYSDDLGGTWSDTIEVNAANGSQFFPALAVDQQTGNLAVSFYSTADDTTPQVEYLATISSDGGRTFEPPITLSLGPSNVAKPPVDYNITFPNAPGSRLQLGDYTEMSFENGVFHSVWADNSFELPENPDAADLDVAAGLVGVANVLGKSLQVNSGDFTAVEDEEGTFVVAGFFDPDIDEQLASDYTATIDWADDTPISQGTVRLVNEQVPSVYEIVGTHKFREKGTYFPTIRLRGRRTFDEVMSVAHVEDAPLTPQGRDFRVVQSIPFTEIIATFTDGNSQSTVADFMAMIDWQDGSSDPGVIVLVGPLGGGKLFQIMGSHSYTAEQNFPVVTTITEIGGETVMATSNITSGDPPITVPSAELTEIGALEDVTTGLVIVAVFELGAGPIDTDADAYSAEVNWDDSQTSPATVSIVGNLVTVRAEHAYADPGIYAAEITLADDSGGAGIAFVAVTVAREITSSVNILATGLVFNSGTQTFHGGIAVTNTSPDNITGPFRIVFDELSPSATLLGAIDATTASDPYIRTSDSILFAGGSLPSLPIEFSVPDPLNATLDYVPRIYAGAAFLGSSLDPATQPFTRSAADGLAFERNRGQIVPGVEYTARGVGYALYLTREEIVLRLDGQEAGKVEASSAVRMRWVGGQPSTRMLGVDRLQGVSNYFLGNDASQWFTDVPNYARVRQEEVYDGIDLELYGRGGELEYDWIVAPGADPRQIVLAFDGADNMEIDAQGALQVTADGTTIVQHRPIAYQHGAGTVEPVQVEYLIDPQGRVRFRLGEYDDTRTLVIDPVLVYASYYGGLGEEAGRDIAVDAAGNTYVVGNTLSIDFPVFDAFQDDYQANPDVGGFGTDVFLTKIAPDGTVVFSTYLGSAGAEGANGIAIDDGGAIYVVGGTDSGDFPVRNALQPELVSGRFFSTDGFITKFDPSGSSLVYSTYFGGAYGDTISDIALGDDGAVYLSGATNTRFGFPVTPGAYQTVHGDPATSPSFPGEGLNADGFLAKISADGQTLLYSTLFGVAGRDVASALRVDAAGRVHVVGATAGADFPVPDGFDTEHGGQLDAYAAILSADGATLEYGTFYGGILGDAATDLVLDANGRMIVVGASETHEEDGVDVDDGFVIAITPDGTLEREIRLGVNDPEINDFATSVAFDSAGHVLVVGNTGASGFPLVRAIQPIYGGGESDGFVMRFDAALENILYATFLGGNGADSLAAVAVGPEDTAYVIGTTISSDLRTVAPTQPSLAVGGVSVQTDVLLARIAPDGRGEIAVAVLPIVATEGTAFDGLVASFTDSDHDQATDYTATIEWGDGSVTQGIVIMSGNGRFQVFGTHVYERYGVYPTVVTIRQADGSLASASGTAAATADGFVDYRVTIDTSSLSGTTGVLALQFNPARTTGVQQAQIVLDTFRLNGGSLVGDPQFAGGALGCVCDVVTIVNSSQLNRLTQAITFGTVLSFNVRVRGDAIANPLAGLFATSFAAQLLAADGLTPLLTDDTAATVLRLDVLPGGATQTTAFTDPAAGHPAARAATVVHARIDDAPLTARETPIEMFNGVPFTAVVATFADANPFSFAAEFSATIDWGDGSPVDLGVITQDGVGEFSISGSHLYEEIGHYLLTITITSLGGKTATIESRPGINGFQASRPTVIDISGWAMASADFDNDGNRDLVVTNGSSSQGERIVVLFGNGDATFAPPVSIIVGGQSLDVEVGDFNNDGLVDFATSNNLGNSVTVVLGNGDRTFRPAIATPLNNANNLDAGDVNHDGNLDLLVNTFVCFGSCFSGMVLMLGNGDGTFGSRPTFPLDNLGGGKLEDLNGDGNLDLMATSGSTYLFARGNGDGTFQPPTSHSVGGFGEVGHIDNDGFLDMVVGGVDAVYVFRGVGDGTFHDPVTYPAATRNELALADFDRDGDLDVISAFGGGQDQFLRGTFVLLNAGDGSFLPAVQYAAPPEPSRPVVDDYNNDGIADVAALQTVGSIVSIGLGLGDGSIAAPSRHDPFGDIPFPIGTTARLIAAADLDHDGDDDVLVKNSGLVEPYATSLLNNGDGTFSMVPIPGLPRGGTTVQLAFLNDDDFPDLLLPAPSESVSIMLGRGDGTFGPPETHTMPRNPASPFTGNTPSRTVVGDVNGDQIVDVIAAAGPHTGLLLGRGDGTFEPPRLLHANHRELAPFLAVGLADFNTDGILDIAATRDQGTVIDVEVELVVALGRGDGTFQPLANYVIGDNFFSLAVADVNGDGRLDIQVATADTVASEVNGSLTVLIGVGDGTFRPPVRYAEGNEYDSLIVADFNLDGRPDMAATGFAAKRGVTVVYNNGDGTFGPPLRYEAAAPLADTIAAGRFNNDDFLDLVGISRDIVGLIPNFGTGQSGARVRNAPLTAEAFDINPVAGLAFTATVAHFDDADTLAVLGDHTALIDWGDGQSSSGTITVDPTGGFLIAGSHTYAQGGEFNLTVTITDDAGGTVQAGATARVTEFNFPITAAPTTITAVALQSFQAVVATFTDAEPNGSVGDFMALIDWGDTSISPGVIVAGQNGFEVIGHHTYQEPGDYVVHVEITDIGGGGAAVDSSAIVSAVNHSPFFASAPVTVAVEGQPYLYLVEGADLDLNDLLILSTIFVPNWLTLVDHGDGTATLSGTPPVGTAGSVDVSLRVADNQGADAVQNFTIIVAPANRPPQPANDTAFTERGVAAIIPVLANDMDPDGTIDPATVTVALNPRNGIAKVDPVNGNITYTPNATFVGTDVFHYTVRDDDGAVSVDATVSVIVCFAILGDTNGDARVDMDDLENVRNYFGENGDQLPGDATCDGRVDVNDLNAVRNNFGADVSGTRVASSMSLRKEYFFTITDPPLAVRLEDLHYAADERARIADIIFARWSDAERDYYDHCAMSRHCTTLATGQRQRLRRR